MLTSIDSVISRFQASPSNALLYYLITAIAVLISLILHENAHGFVALWSGDPTAKMLGRLSLNPSKHLDPLGTVSMLLFHFGWAKPVPINPQNFKHYKRDFIFVSLAGIAMNLLLFLLFMIVSVLLNQVLWNNAMIAPYSPSDFYFAPYNVISSMSVRYRDMLAPSELAGFLKVPALMYLQFFFQELSICNLSLAIFNLLPIPPLDGFRVIQGFAGKRMRITPQIMQIIQFAMIALLITGIISKVINFIFDPIYIGVLDLLNNLFGFA